MEVGLPVKARLVRADNQWGMNKTSLIIRGLQEIYLETILYFSQTPIRDLPIVTIP
ncbi:hypothetical protein bcgnr5398_20110 [Bacillus cereus]|nr:hypothetical protein BCN_1438 [Bacillus cereus NC7401]BCC16942.1 hypothetical protein BCM0075_1712 [Bacillus cereus]